MREDESGSRETCARVCVCAGERDRQSVNQQKEEEDIKKGRKRAAGGSRQDKGSQTEREDG